MTTLPTEVDVAVIGAGSAGIAAGRRLAEAGGVSVLVLEARERAGGRAWTVEADGLPMDLGCEWLHSADRNVLAPLAKKFGFAINTERPDWTARLRNSGESEAAEADWNAERISCVSRSHRAADNPLRAGGRLGIACGIEYAAQAMAVHGALIAGAPASRDIAATGGVTST